MVSWALWLAIMVRHADDARPCAYCGKPLANKHTLLRHCRCAAYSLHIEHSWQIAHELSAAHVHNVSAAHASSVVNGGGVEEDVEDSEPDEDDGDGLSASDDAPPPPWYGECDVHDPDSHYNFKAASAHAFTGGFINAPLPLYRSTDLATDARLDDLRLETLAEVPENWRRWRFTGVDAAGLATVYLQDDVTTAARSVLQITSFDIAQDLVDFDAETRLGACCAALLAPAGEEPHFSGELQHIATTVAIAQANSKLNAILVALAGLAREVSELKQQAASAPTSGAIPLAKIRFSHDLSAAVKHVFGKQLGWKEPLKLLNKHNAITFLLDEPGSNAPSDGGPPNRAAALHELERLQASGARIAGERKSGSLEVIRRSFNIYDASFKEKSESLSNAVMVVMGELQWANDDDDADMSTYDLLASREAAVIRNMLLLGSADETTASGAAAAAEVLMHELRRAALFYGKDGLGMKSLGSPGINLEDFFEGGDISAEDLRSAAEALKVLPRLLAALWYAACVKYGAFGFDVLRMEVRMSPAHRALLARCYLEVVKSYWSLEDKFCAALEKAADDPSESDEDNWDCGESAAWKTGDKAGVDDGNEEEDNDGEEVDEDEESDDEKSDDAEGEEAPGGGGAPKATREDSDDATAAAAAAAAATKAAEETAKANTNKAEPLAAARAAEEKRKVPAHLEDGKALAGAQTAKEDAAPKAKPQSKKRPAPAAVSKRPARERRPNARFGSE
ncbi:hypothetical protein M885DRAFT_624185 [Pelagophyceae sp. CCMP2097]|nr:hypothetical protein M885DRAFT_624185 [Pelagophyceae sp. CCMP2097]